MFEFLDIYNQAFKCGASFNFRMSWRRISPESAAKFLCPQMRTIAATSSLKPKWNGGRGRESSTSCCPSSGTPWDWGTCGGFPTCATETEAVGILVDMKRKFADRITLQLTNNFISGAFLIPFISMMLLAGLPLMFMELSFGQYASLGPIAIFDRFCPLFAGESMELELLTIFSVAGVGCIVSGKQREAEGGNKYV